MFQDSEFINLVVAAFSVVFIYFRKNDFAFMMPRGKYIFLGYYAIVCAYVFTVVEGFVLGDLFNFLEHASYAAAGVLFALGARSLTSNDNPSGPEGKP